MKEDNELIDKQETLAKIDETDNSKRKYKLESSKPKLLIITYIAIFTNAILKLIIVYNMARFILDNISTLFAHCLKFFPNKDLLVFLYYINYLFLFFGIIGLFIEPILQIYIRIYFITSNNQKLLYLICSKLMYFALLGLVPESTFLMFKFNNKNNVIIPLFIIKIYFQPILLIALIIYGIFILLSFKGKDILINFKRHSLIYLGIIKTIARLNMFRWKILKEKDSENNGNDNEDEEEDDEDLIPVKSTIFRYAAFITFFAVLLSPMLNGIFHYGFFVFFFTQSFTCLLFKLDIVISVIFTLLTLKLIK